MSAWSTRTKPGGQRSPGVWPKVRWAFRARGSRTMAEAVLSGPDLLDAFLEKVEGLDGIADYEHYVATK